MDIGDSLSTERKSSLVSAAYAQLLSNVNPFRADFGHIHPYEQSKPSFSTTLF